MEIQNLIDEYINFIKKGISFRRLERGYEITTPFLNDCNDHIQIYVDEIEEGRILLSDGGDTLSYLEDMGVFFKSTRKTMIENAVRSYGVEISKDRCLTIKASARDFPQKKHNLIQAILKVNDMEYTQRTNVASIFADDIEEYFKTYEVPCVRNMSVVGKSGLYQSYDFVLSPYKKLTEKFCKVINNPTKNAIINAIFTCNDTAGFRSSESQFCVFLKLVIEILVLKMLEFG